jgi:23S rRNA (cytidine1920-2'-O)/16S rRNA (cytidine1409-2'-O)-methyltransferase
MLPAIRRRLDTELVQRKLVPSRGAAHDAVAAGRVVVDGAVVTKPAQPIGPGQRVELIGGRARYVSRAGAKLEHALDTFGISPAGLRCLDAGASTGGFTDCLLQRGAARVVAVDVGTGQLHPRLAANPLVTSLEQTDVRGLDPARIGGPAELTVVDLSFISLRLTLPALGALTSPGAPLVALVKPQFEAGRAEAARTQGVIRHPAVWRRVLADVVATADDQGMSLRTATVSGITGAGGNVEFVVWLSSARQSQPGPTSAQLLDLVVADAQRSLT